MAVLNAQLRAAIKSEWMRENDEACGIVKSELQAAVNAIDDWVDANTTSFNNSIPQPARGTLTARQKARLLAAVVKARFVEGV